MSSPAPDGREGLAADHVIRAGACSFIYLDRSTPELAERITRAIDESMAHHRLAAPGGDPS